MEIQPTTAAGCGKHWIQRALRAVPSASCCRGTSPAGLRRLASWMGIRADPPRWPRSYFDYLPGAWRGIRETALAQEVLEAGPTAAESLRAASPAVVRRVLGALMHPHLLGGRAETVLAVMQDRQMLEAATAHGPGPAGPQRITLPSPEQQKDQWRRVVPLVPPWLHFCLVVLLGLAATALSLGAFTWLRTHTWLDTITRISGVETGQFMTAYGWYLAFGLGLYFAVVHHTAFPRGWALAHLPLLLLGCGFIALSSVLGSAHICALSHSNIVAVLSLLSIRLLAPELIARWRGINLLYPTRYELWMNRLLSVIGFVVLSLAMGAIHVYLI
jgi:hypothetical protein